MFSLFVIVSMFVLCACMSLCVQLPLATALWPYYHEGLPVLSGEPQGEAMQSPLHIWSLNNR